MRRITLTQQQIDDIFATATHQAEAIVDLYKLVVPNWEQVESMDGWPLASKTLSNYLFTKFIDFDSIHHPNVMKGGAWMNSGFSTADDDSGIGPWEVDTSELKVTYKKEGEQS